MTVQVIKYMQNGTRAAGPMFDIRDRDTRREANEAAQTFPDGGCAMKATKG